jgi:hypothetical protein
VANQFVVKLDADERTRLSDLISKGKAAAKTTLKARILLKADQREAGEGWSDEAISRRSTPTSPWLSASGPSWWRRGSTRR